MCLYYDLPKVSLWTGRCSRTDGRLFTVLASLQRGAAVVAPGGRSGAPDSHRTELADPPEHWPAASTCDAAAVITREPNFWLVLIISIFNVA